MLVKWFKSKPERFQYALIGAISYPFVVCMFLILSIIAGPFGFRAVFDEIIKTIIYPASYIGLKIVYQLIKNPMEFWIPMIGLLLFFLLIMGALIGLLCFYIRNIYQKIKYN